MKLTLCLSLFIFQMAHAFPVLSVKERLRLHLWNNGLEEKSHSKVKGSSERRSLPEELQRTIRKF